MIPPLTILYEDNHVIAVYKPAGLLVQGDISGEESLMDVVKTYLKETYKKPGNVFLGLIHRLDRNVDGVVVFAKTSKGASRLSEQFRVHSVEKMYHAWVHGKPQTDKQTLVHFLCHNEKNNRTDVFDKEKDGSQRAELVYEIVKSEADPTTSEIFSCLRIRLMTGRHHQIRAQLAHIGHPIIGDVKYGSSKKLPDQKIALTATSLMFTTATTDERKTITLEVPPRPW